LNWEEHLWTAAFSARSAHDRRIFALAMRGGRAASVPACNHAIRESRIASARTLEDARKFAADQQGIDEASAIERGFHEKAKEFQQAGAEIYDQAFAASFR
jgi:hypothetical protein